MLGLKVRRLLNKQKSALQFHRCVTLRIRTSSMWGACYMQSYLQPSRA